MFWLYEQVLNEQEGRAPIFSQRSTVNWMHALRYEIEAEHGEPVDDQFKACCRILRNSRKTNPALGLASVFEPLYSGISSSMMLDRLSQAQTSRPWMRPSAIVTWYFAIYACTRSMFAAFGQIVKDNHTAAANFFASSLSQRLPHPLNMCAKHAKDECYDLHLPTHPHAVFEEQALNKNFIPSRDVARSMLLEYLSGSTKWYTEQTKQQLLKESHFPFQNFRKNEARKVRNGRLQKQIGFLHCAYRYRGKANYRDAIYLTYGEQEPPVMQKFLEDLAVTSKFFVILALAFAERHCNTQEVVTFLSDVHKHLRGITAASQSELYWENLYRLSA